MTKSTQFIPEVFIELTKNTYPHGTENIIIDKMYKLGLFPEGIDMDGIINYFVNWWIKNNLLLTWYGLKFIRHNHLAWWLWLKQMVLQH